VDISSDHLRRLVQDSQDAHDAAMPEMRNALSRLFGTRDHSDAKADVVLGGLERRGFLRVGGLAVASGAILAACGTKKNNANTSSATTTTLVVSMKDQVVLRTASSLEEVAVAVYQKALDAGLLKTPAIADAAKAFAAQHKAHSLLFQAETVKAGGTPYSQPNAAVLAAIAPQLAALSDETGALRVAYDLEQAAAATYQAAVGNVDDLQLNVAFMSVGGVEARHVAVLGGLISQPQVSGSGFALTDKAVAPGTGL
jgi:rubrerythrin